jgi:tRNA uridine 5-carboxymethylaminomethyl modification enzyme
MSDALAILAEHWLAPNPRSNGALVEAGLEPVTRPMTALDVLRRPEARGGQIARALASLGEEHLVKLPGRVLAAVELEAKYGAFINRALRDAARFAKLEGRALPPDFDYDAVGGLRIEARQKLARSRPLTIAQAGRLAGVTPADVAALLVHTTRMARSAAGEAMPR